MLLSKKLKCIKIGNEYYNGLWKGKITTTSTKRECLATNVPQKELYKIKRVIKKKANKRYNTADLKVIDY